MLSKTILFRLGNTSLLFISFWTFGKKNVLFLVLRNVKGKWYESMLIIETGFLMFDRFTWSGFESCLSHTKMSSSLTHKLRNSSQFHTSMFPSYPPIHQNICCPKCRFLLMWDSKQFLGAFFFTDTPTRRNISNMTCLISSYRYLKPRSFLQWIVCSSNVSKLMLWQTGHTSSIGSTRIIRW